MSDTLEVRITISPEALHQRVGEEVVILDLAGEQYYGLNAVGSRIWALIEEDYALAQIAEVIAREFDAPAELVQADLRTLIDALVDAGLVVIVT